MINCELDDSMHTIASIFLADPMLQPVLKPAAGLTRVMFPTECKRRLFSYPQAPVPLLPFGRTSLMGLLCARGFLVTDDIKILQLPDERTSPLPRSGTNSKRVPKRAKATSAAAAAAAATDADADADGPQVKKPKPTVKLTIQRVLPGSTFLRATPTDDPLFNVSVQIQWYFTRLIHLLPQQV